MLSAAVPQSLPRVSSLAVRIVLAFLIAASLRVDAGGQVRLTDESDRTAFRAWFVFLADTQFYRSTPDVTDCAALIRHAYREALRPHTPEWVRLARLPLAAAYPDVRRTPKVTSDVLPLFRVSGGDSPRYAEFADAKTIIRQNARLLGRSVEAARPGDLLYFYQPEQDQPDHLMVYVGSSVYERDGRDWIVYHTGGTSGEVRKVQLTDLLRHPSPRWRPVAANSHFVGVFRLAVL